MKRESILLPIDGSISSAHAARLCWRITTSVGAKLTAQHIVDLSGAAQLLTHESAGLLPESAYLSAYESIHHALTGMVTELEKNYMVEAARHGARSNFVIDEGDPVTEITKRATEHDLVVIGHARCEGDGFRRKFKRLSVAEQLAHDCPRPLLIVQDSMGDITSMTIIISPEHVNENYIDACLNLAKVLELEPAIVCVSVSGEEIDPEHYTANLRQSNHRLADISIAMGKLEDITTSHETPLAAYRYLRLQSASKKVTLPVLPTRYVGGERVTILGGSPVMFLRHLDLPTILLFPEESSSHVLAQTDASRAANRS